jgi:hypothetical protein
VKSPSRRTRRRLLQFIVLIAGLVGIALVAVESVDQAQEQVLPSPTALAGGGLLAIGAIASSARTWTALFSDLVASRQARASLRGTVYLSQLTKYLPAGGVVQAGSQVGLAQAFGVPLRRAVIAFPVSAVIAVAGASTLAAGLAFDSSLEPWVRTLAGLGLLSPALLHRGFMARLLTIARRVSHRIPPAEELPTQRDIFNSYGWALLTTGALSVAYAVMLDSVADTQPFMTFSAFAASWVVGFLAVPLPAGVGVREAVLVALLPGVGAGPLLAVSLALRLLSIAAELLALAVNRVVQRRHSALLVEASPSDEAPTM